MDDIGFFYSAQTGSTGTHLALRWKGRVRYIVPRNATTREQCWDFFRPGKPEYPLRILAFLKCHSGMEGCVESAQLKFVRDAIGSVLGDSCCRTGTPGAWSKDTILFLNKHTTEPLYVVKVGTGAEVNLLLQNEANWLHTLRDIPVLSDCIPELIAHRFDENLSFVAERPLSGDVNYIFSEPHATFLRALQKYSYQRMRLEESKLYCNLQSRLRTLEGILSDEWSLRLVKGIRRLEELFSGRSMLFVAAHNDFTQWNIRVERGIARVFDWEYAEYEQLPLMDPLHFTLMPMALHNMTNTKMFNGMRVTLQYCRQWLGEESCSVAQAQILSYLMSTCAMFLFSVQKVNVYHPVLDCYGRLIDCICLR